MSALLERLRTAIGYAHYQLVAFALGGVALWVLTSVSGVGPALSRDVFENAIALDPRYATGQRIVGQELAREGRVAEALLHLRAAREADPHDGTVCLPLGQVAKRQGALDEARSALECAVKTAPANVEAWEAVADVALSQADWPRTIEATRKALELDPTRNPLRMNLGTALARSGDAAGAEKVFAEAVRRAPDDAAMVFNLALAMKKRGALDEAASWLTRAVTLDPKQSRAWFTSRRPRRRAGGSSRRGPRPTGCSASSPTTPTRCACGKTSRGSERHSSCSSMMTPSCSWAAPGGGLFQYMPAMMRSTATVTSAPPTTAKPMTRLASSGSGFCRSERSTPPKPSTAGSVIASAGQKSGSCAPTSRATASAVSTQPNDSPSRLDTFIVAKTRGTG